MTRDYVLRKIAAGCTLSVAKMHAMIGGRPVMAYRSVLRNPQGASIAVLPATFRFRS